MEQDYRIETLAETFADHAKITDKQQEQMVKKYREEYPEQELPPHMVNPFNLAQALSVMCEEIQKLWLK